MKAGGGSKLCFRGLARRLLLLSESPQTTLARRLLSATARGRLASLAWLAGYRHQPKQAGVTGCVFWFVALLMAL